jgi:pimeloyl-ACP methyl ester carboxylesterase
LLHGYLTSSAYWQKVVPSLNEYFTVITIDLLGFGQSPKPKESAYDAPAQVEYVHDILSGYSDITLVGHSMGSLIATEYALMYPASVKRLVLLNPPIFLDQKQAREEIRRTNLGHDFLLYRPFGRAAWPILRAATAGIKRDMDPRNPANVFRGHSHYSRKRSLIGLIEKTHLLEQLKHLSLPVTIIAGKHDRAIYRSNLDLQGMPAGARLIWLDTGHHSLLDEPETIIAELRGTTL